MSKKCERKVVPVNEGWQGHILASPIYKLVGGRNVLLLREGWKLSLSNIHSLRRHGVKQMEVMAEKPMNSNRESNSNSVKKEDKNNEQNDEGG